MSGVRSLAFVLALMFLMSSAAAGILSGGEQAVDVSTDGRVGDVGHLSIPTFAAADASMTERLSAAWNVPTLAPVDDPRDLATLVADWDARLGAARLTGAYTALDTLDPTLVTAVRDLLATLWAVQDARDQAFAGIRDADLLRFLHTESDPAALDLVAGVDHALVRSAAVTLAAAVDRNLPLLRTLAPAVHIPHGTTGPLVDLAPVLMLDPLGADDLYEKDAILMVDLGGDDTYDANAGGAMIHQGLVGDPATCQTSASGLYIGCENEDSFMSFTASLLIEVAGHDTYGVYKEPRPGSRDPRCTSEPIIRRVVTYGSGVGGIGMLVDASGDDAYRGKTLTMGNGHIAGAGAFFDLTGDDTYDAVRSGPGSGVLNGVGFFFEGSGRDIYTMKAPTSQGSQGTGLFNADSGRCDQAGRLALGAAVLQSTGTFVDLAGDDVYQIQSQAFGFGSGGAVGQFIDLGGNDDYGGYAGIGNDQAKPGLGTFIDQAVTPTA